MQLLAPREGKDCATTITQIDDILLELGNVQSRSNEIHVTIDQYVRWCEKAERVLREAFIEPELWQDLYTDRHWRIRGASPGAEPARLPVMLLDEIAWQSYRIRTLAESLSQSVAQLASETGSRLVVLDTNVFLHCQLFDQVPWETIAGSKTARLILPLVVVDELDTLKDSNSKTGQRAAKVVKLIRTLAKDDLDAFDVRKNVTAQLLSEPTGYVRASNADDEIVRQASWVNRITGNVILLTRDLGMQIRALRRDVPQEQVPTLYDLPRDPSAPASPTTPTTS